MNTYYTKNNTQKGFSLVETLVAISILSLSILGTFTAVQSSLASSSFLKDQIVAMYLIQDAMESVRNMRDTNDVISFRNARTGGASVSWLANMSSVGSDPCYFGKVCRVDSIGSMPAFTYCGLDAGSCDPISQNNDPESLLYKSFGYIENTGWTKTRFKREIVFSKPTSANSDPSGELTEVVVTVTVEWTSGTFNKTLSVSQSFFNLR